MDEVSIIGIDLAKNVFRLHGAAAGGTVVLRKKLTRPRFQKFMASHSSWTVAMEACPGSHHWAREMTRLGHTVRVISPQYVTPYVKRQKNDAAEAEAIAEAATRPHMRFVEPKSAEQQARDVVFRVSQKGIAQRIESIKVLHSHLHEFGFIAPVGPITAKTIEAFAPLMETFKRGRDFAAWLGFFRDRVRSAARHGWVRSQKPVNTTFADC